MKMRPYLLILAATTLFFGCHRSFDSAVSVQKADSISKAITPLLLQNDYARAMAVVDSADGAGLLAPFNATYLRARILSRDESRVREAEQLCLSLLESDVDDRQRLAVLELLNSTSRRRGDDLHALEYGTQYMALCRQLGERAKALSTQAEMGTLLIRTGRTEEGLSQLDDAIRQLDGIERFAETDACILAIKSKIRALVALERYEEIIPLGKRIVAKLQDFEAHPDKYADGSPRVPREDRRAGYVDFYSGQAFAFVAYAYAITGQKDQARVYSRLFEQTDYGRRYDGRKLMATAWCLLGEYAKMEAVYDEMETALGADTIHHDYAVDLYNRAVAADAKGQKSQSANYWKRYGSLLKQINNAERLALAQEHAARYHEQEQQYALDREHSARQRNKFIAWTLSFLLLLISAFVVAVVYQLKTVRRKNALLSDEIASNADFKDKYFRLMARLDVPAEKKDEESIATLDTMPDNQLFEFLRVVIVGEKLYADPAFDRQQLMDRFHLSKERIGSAFSKGSPYGSLPNYVNECRLNASAWLLKQNPDLPVNEVAVACGYSNAGSFATLFRKRYSLSPTDFRRKG